MLDVFEIWLLDIAIEKKFLLEPSLFRLTKYAKGYSDIFLHC